MSSASASSPRRTDGGWSLFETMVAIGIIATGLMVLVQQMSISFRESHANENRAFAYQKAAAILGEIQNSIMLGALTTSDELYGLVDAEPNIVLTTRHDLEGLLFAPEHPMSGNTRRRDHWVWARRLAVSPHENTGLYYARVELLSWGDDGQWHSEATHAQLFSLLPSTEAPEQVHDVYLLACAEAASLQGDLAELRTHFESAARTIMGQSQARVRLHWITRLGYGRDPCYMPFVNTVRSADVATPMAYWLPSLLGGAQSGLSLYHSELLAGTHLTEVGYQHGQSARESVPSAIADQWNNCLRTPAAWRLFDQRVAAGLEHRDEPPLQLLLDDMDRRPEAYRNAIFVNLHGRGVPVPPLRNYSDPAKEPVGLPGVRVVAHPEQLWTPRDPNGDGNNADTQDVAIRVYGYRTTGTGAVLTDPVTVQIFGVNLTGVVNGGATSTLLIDRLAGGIDTSTGKASTTVGYTPFAAAPTSATQPAEMWFQTGYAGGAQPYTWIKLYNTPLNAPAVGLRGLATGARLYGFEYSPSPVSGSFAQDLATDSAGLMMRNTARWRIRVPKQAFVAGLLPNSDQVLRIVTRIGTDMTTGQRWPDALQPLNYSETWTWWTRQSTAVPTTERAQFLGDPRLCPYADLMATGTSFPHGYNWNFDDLVAGAQNAQLLWPCLDATRLQEGFVSGPRADAPRLLQLLRDALQRDGAVFTAPADRLADTLLLGGEIALPTATGTTGVLVGANFTGGSLSTVDTIDPAAGALVLQRGNPPTWWAMPWLGELFPDDLGLVWTKKAGNVPIEGASGMHWRKWQGNALPNLPYGTAFTSPIGAVMGAHGAPVFVASQTLIGTAFTVGAVVAQTQRALAATEAINTATNLVPPSGLTGARVIAPDGLYALPAAAFASTDVFPHSSFALLENAWGASSGTTGLIGRWTGAGGSAWLAAWSPTPSPQNNRELALQALLLGIRALHAGGQPSQPATIPQLPKLQILEPAAGSSRTDPDALLVRWQTQWLRFDGEPYTAAYPTPYAQSESDLVYRVLWSGDNGTTWTSALTDTPTVPEAWPENPAERLADAGTGNESFTFGLPPSLAPGEYRIRVEAWRVSTHCHSASHDVRMFVRRTSP